MRATMLPPRGGLKWYRELCRGSWRNHGGAQRRARQEGRTPFGAPLRSHLRDLFRLSGFVVRRLHELVLGQADLGPPFAGRMFAGTRRKLIHWRFVPPCGLPVPPVRPASPPVPLPPFFSQSLCPPEPPEPGLPPIPPLCP